MEGTYIIRQIAGKAYQTQQELADRYSLSKKTVQRRLAEIKENSGVNKRYSQKSVIEDGNIVFINELVFLDWLKVRQAWKNENSRKHIKPFDPTEWVKYLGWCEMPTVTL